MMSAAPSLMPVGGRATGVLALNSPFSSFLWRLVIGDREQGERWPLVNPANQSQMTLGIAA